MCHYSWRVVGGGYAQNFQKGEEAADKGDFATALREWRPLAEQGNADAQNNLGAMYDKGQGVPQDYKEAFNWYRKSAEQGDALAHIALGLMYRNGRGVPQDYKEAVNWFRKSAEQGDAEARRKHVPGTRPLKTLDFFGSLQFSTFTRWRHAEKY